MKRARVLQNIRGRWRYAPIPTFQEAPATPALLDLPATPMSRSEARRRQMHYAARQRRVRARFVVYMRERFR